MRYPTAASALLALVIVPAASAGLPAQSVLARANPGPPTTYAASASLRVGVHPLERDAVRAQAPDTTETAQGSGSHRAAHAAIGAGLGLAAGAAVGAVIMSVSDKHDGGIGLSPAEAGALLGGVIGLVVGAIVGSTVR